LGAAAAIYFIRSKRIKAPVRDTKPQLSLQEKALQVLAELEAKKLWEQGKVKNYYVELTDIVRGYIEARFNTPALELTTDELLYKARTQQDLMPIASQLEQILRTADLAKFAKAQPLPEEHVAAIQNAKEIVSITRPVIIENQPNQPS
jgi:hypothetical protein